MAFATRFGRWSQAGVHFCAELHEVLLADPAVPLVAVTLKESALAAAGPLVRLPYLESLLDCAAGHLAR